MKILGLIIGIILVGGLLLLLVVNILGIIKDVKKYRANKKAKEEKLHRDENIERKE